MNKHSTTMASLLRGFPRFEFQSIVDEYHGDKGVRTLSTYHTLTAMLYVQITSAFGMREIVKTLEANRNKLYHSGLSEVKRSTLSDALEKLRKRSIVPLIRKRGTEHGSGLGRYRWVVERTLSWLHQFRRLRVRFEKRDDIHEALVILGCIMICWSALVSWSPLS